MPPRLALTLTIVVILWLFKTDSRQHCTGSAPALWIPCIWMVILGSRPVSVWLGVESSVQSPSELLRGSPVDRTVFLLLIGAGLVVLCRREIRWAIVVRDNVWLGVFFLYCGVSVI